MKNFDKDIKTFSS